MEKECSFAKLDVQMESEILNEDKSGDLEVMDRNLWCTCEIIGMKP